MSVPESASPRYAPATTRTLPAGTVILPFRLTSSSVAFGMFLRTLCADSRAVLVISSAVTSCAARTTRTADAMTNSSCLLSSRRPRLAARKCTMMSPGATRRDIPGRGSIAHLHTRQLRRQGFALALNVGDVAQAGSARCLISEFALTRTTADASASALFLGVTGVTAFGVRRCTGPSGLCVNVVWLCVLPLIGRSTSDNANKVGLAILGMVLVSSPGRNRC